MDNVPDSVKTFCDDECKTIATLKDKEFCKRLTEISSSTLEIHKLFTVLIYLEKILKISDAKSKLDAVLRCLSHHDALETLYFSAKNKHEKVFYTLLEHEGMYWNKQPCIEIFDSYPKEKMKMITNFFLEINFISISATRFSIYYRQLDGIKSLVTAKKLFVADQQLLWLCLYYESASMTELLIKNGAPTSYKDENEGTTLHIAIRKLPELVVKTILPYCKDQVTSHVEKHGNTPLHLCYNDSYLDIAKELVSLGADVNACNDFGCTPLHIINMPGSEVDVNKKKIYNFLKSCGSYTGKRDLVGLVPGDISIGSHTIYFKGLLLGDCGVGKTCLDIVFREGKDGFFSHNGQPTIGMGFHKITNCYNNHIKYELMLWDAAGQENFRGITSRYIRNSQIIFIIFDVTRENSFLALSHYVNQIKLTENDALIFLVGNKIDLKDKREVSSDSIAKLKCDIAAVTRSDVICFEVSCKTAENIKELFDAMIMTYHFNYIFPQLHQRIKKIGEIESIHAEGKNIHYSGFIKNISFSNFSYSLCPLSAAVVLSNCDYKGYMQKKQLFYIYWRSLLFVLNGLYLYWFKNENSTVPVGCIKLSDVDSITTSNENQCDIHLSMTENQDIAKSLVFRCVDIACASLWKQKISQVETCNSHVENADKKSIKKCKTLPIEILDKIVISEDELVQLDLSHCGLTMSDYFQVDLRSTKLKFFQRTVKFLCHKKSIKIYNDLYAASDSGKTFLLDDTWSGVKLFFRTERPIEFIASFKDFIRTPCFSGDITTQMYAELFYIAIRDAYSKLMINPKHQLIEGIDAAWKENKPMETIDLQGSLVTIQDIFALTHGLKFYPWVTSLNLRKSNIDSNGVCILLERLTGYRSLEYLDLGRNSLNCNNLKLLFPKFLCASKLKVLNCVHTDIESDTFRLIFQTLKVHSTLKFVDFSFNNVNDCSCAALSNIIETNLVIEEIKLWYSKITEDGSRLLLEAFAYGQQTKLRIDLSSSGFLSQDTIVLFEDVSSAKENILKNIGSIRPVWVADEFVNECICGTVFALFNRRHHCRACGKVFCCDCSSFEVALQYKNNSVEKVCVKCYALIQKHKLDKKQDHVNTMHISKSSSSLNHLTTQPDDVLPQTKDDMQLRNLEVKQTSNKPSDFIQSKLDEFINCGVEVEPAEETNTFTLTQILKQFLAAQKEVLDSQKETLDKILQRQVMHYQTLMEFYQMSIHMVQIRTPRTFCILPSPNDKSWKKPATWSNSTFRLHLLCEGSKGGAVGDIHFLENHGGYLIIEPSEFFQKVIPVLSIGMKVFSVAAKLAGSVIGIGGLIPSDDVMKKLFGISKGASNIAGFLDQVWDTVHRNALELDESDAQVVTGAALRALEVFLKENDPLQNFGGLQSVAGPNGRLAWVCDKHAM